jgi:hypothetical protein
VPNGSPLRSRLSSIGLDLDGARFTIRLDGSRLEVTPGQDGAVDLAVATDTEQLIQFLAGAEVPLEAEGDRELLGRLPALFPLRRTTT